MSRKSFIETQFPVSKVSKESYKERKAVQSQTLTGLGKWWGRKPLILVRAALLGLLMPASQNAKKDGEIFLKILTMDNAGLQKRKNRRLSAKYIADRLTLNEQSRYFETDALGKRVAKFQAGLSPEERLQAENLAWSRMSYDERLACCSRPEEISVEDENHWKAINEHLGTIAENLPDLFRELGERRFGHVPLVGDSFCGGGSIPYEAARCGLHIFASDLNPIGGLLTKANLTIGMATDKDLERLRIFQDKVFREIDKKIRDMGVETNEAGDRGNVYLYCTEIICPECGWKIPVASSWLIGMGSRTVAVLKENAAEKRFDIEIYSGVDSSALKKAKDSATVNGDYIVCPHCHKQTPTQFIRRLGRGADSGLRQWNVNEFKPRPDDVMQERLYCIRYEHVYLDGKGNIRTERYYQAPDENDLDREAKVEAFIANHIAEWQEKGYMSSSEIIDGEKTKEPIKDRGWKYWHHLFLPRQLLLHGLLLQKVDEYAENNLQLMAGLLSVNRCANWNSKLCGWGVGQARESMAQTFYNQALNTLWEETARGLSLLEGNYWLPYDRVNFSHSSQIPPVLALGDARANTQSCDIWITDPPYADAVNYHELSEFFLAWDKKLLERLFPDGYTDSKRVLAVRGKDESFNRSMVAIYKNLANHMPDDGMQIIMFTHQDVAVWADLAMVVWSAGLQVTAAWNIITETDASGLKNGNYVKGTVLLVLRKQQGNSTAYLDELMPDIEDEVKRQIESMQALDDKEDPNFTDADYILAAYAAALKVLTSVSRIEDIDVEYELSHQRERGEVSEIAKIIEEAKKIAYDQLIPQGFDHFIWRMMEPAERFYIKGLEAEKNGIYQISTYQELARGFGVTDYRALLADTRANSARLRTGGEWKRRNLDDGFGATLLRHVLMALYIATKDESSSPLEGKTYLRAEVSDYWNKRDRIQEILKFVAAFRELSNMSAWHDEAEAAKIIKELVANDGI